MKVLSIDIDFITDNYSDKISKFGGSPANIKWNNFYKNANLNEINTDINYENFSYILDIFNKCAKKNSNVMFAINHHSILLELDKDCNNSKKIDIINIDHHHDILYNPDEIINVEKFDHVNCGTWVWYLENAGRINSYCWVKNKNSSIFNEGMTSGKNPNNYKACYKDELKMEIDIRDIEFDFIFVCLSPEFILPEHWSYFHMLRNMHEQKIGKKIEFIQNVPEVNEKHLNFDLYKNIVLNQNNCSVGV